MRILIVVENRADWPLQNGVEVVLARDYLSDPTFSELRRARVLNLCRDYRYQATGYYVSLLADARGHRPMPSVQTIQDFKMRGVARVISDELDQLATRSLERIHGDHFELSIYFGRNLAKRHARLAQAIFRQFPAPLLRAEFVRDEDQWRTKRIQLIPYSAVPESHHAFAAEAATDYFRSRMTVKERRDPARFDMAILVDPDEEKPPSNDRALRRFERAAKSAGFRVQRITRDDQPRIAEFDALFIRATTLVNHYTYRFARRAAAEGVVVIDDPTSILRCTNKVYLAEVLKRHNVPTLPTTIVHAGNRARLEAELSLPVVLKQPDSAFSAGVARADTRADLHAAFDRLFATSELVLAQDYLPTSFDWRVGVLDRKPLYVCRYFMADDHWQIVKRTPAGRLIEGDAETMAVDAAPPPVIETAVRAANLIGDGLYGVDLKEIDGRVVVVEVNDNPNIDAGVEDEVLGDELYERLAHVFRRRVERRLNPAAGEAEAKETGRA